MNDKEISQVKTNARQLFVDVSTLIHVDDTSGIQRVVKNILQSFLQSPPHTIRIQPVYRKQGGYWCTGKFTEESSSTGRIAEDNLVHINTGDIFLGLDFDHKFDVRAQRFLQRQQRKHGLQVYFVVYDLLAVTHPEWFNLHLSKIIRKWLQRVVAVADGLVCISESVALELKQYLGDHKAAQDVKVGYFHLGADIPLLKKDCSLTADESLILRWLKEQVVFLMVGTLEPRKGHAQVLDAMTELWLAGEDVLLVVAGKKGWKVEHLIQSINRHPENGEHLFWFENVSDAFLLQLYNHASALIMASEGEGFGLPLIEAAHHKLPLIVRDLPVFREVAGDNAWYFSGLSVHDLQQSLADWLVVFHQEKHPGSDGIQQKTWMQSSEQLLNLVLQKKWIE